MSRVEAAFAAVSKRMEQHSDEIRPFAEWLAARQPRNAIEIGVRWGGTSMLLCGLCSGLVVGVDWAGRDSLGPGAQERAGSEIEELCANYRFVLGDSRAAATVARVANHVSGEVDLLFIDGDHSYDAVKADFELYVPLVRKGGCVAFHDIVDSELIRSAGHGVHRFWRELSGKKLEFNLGLDWGGIGVLEIGVPEVA